MKNKFRIALIVALIAFLPANAESFFMDESSYYTGESFFGSDLPETKEIKVKSEEEEEYTGEVFFTSSTGETAVRSKKERCIQRTDPPIKKLRLMIKSKIDERNRQNNELAPTPNDAYVGEIETSEYASKDVVDDFEDAINPDGFEADEEAQIEAANKKKRFFGKKKNKNVVEKNDDIILDCDDIDYDTQNYKINAKGNVCVEFVRQKTKVKADRIIFDRANNTITAEGNVKIYKQDNVISGDYIFVDMNEENALIENPYSESSNIVMHSKKGYVYGDKIVQENGTIEVEGYTPIEFHSANRGPRIRKMIVPKGTSLSDDINKGTVKVSARDIKITQKGDLEIISVKRLKLSKNGRTLIKVPSVKLYTNKNLDFVEIDGLEVSGTRSLGIFGGPGVVVELPHSSVLKLMPIVSYKSGFGIGGMGRFSSATNQTMIGYASNVDRFVGRGIQRLDDHLFLQYGMNDYLDEWFMGRRRPKYGVGLVYENSYASKNFLLKNRSASFKHRLEGGYYNDIDYDKHFEHLKGNDIGTTRFRYMADAAQNLFSYRNEEKQTALSFGVVAQLSAAVYGTGDTQVIARVAPHLHMQYKRWMQDIGYYFAAIDDHSPMPVFDSYRYGKQNVYVREYFRICKYLTLSWCGSICVLDDSPNGRYFQENAFYVSLGPDDLKLNVGYDFIRENLYCTVEVMMNAKGVTVDYDKLEIKQDKKAQNEKKITASSEYNPAAQDKILEKAVVEDIKVTDELL